MKKKFGFETLEDRRVMSADSVLEIQSGSSDTPEGQLFIAVQEQYWQQLIEANSGGFDPAALTTNALPTDPLLDDQWYLINTGQKVSNPDSQSIFGVPGEDINVADAWNLGYTGDGVVVAVLDSGVQTNHPDLAANIHPTLGFDALNNSGDGNADLNIGADAHGTAVAGIIAAVADNGIGGTGVAPNAQIVPIRLIVDPTSQDQILPDSIEDAFRFAWDEIDITNNSWGGAISRALSPVSPTQLSAIRDSISFGRDGLGTIHVFSAGNDAGPAFAQQGLEGFFSIGQWDSAAYDGFADSRYVVAVTGVDHDGGYNNFDGTVTAYPEVSASTLVAAPTGSNAGSVIGDDLGFGSGIFTTDFTGEEGFNAPPDPQTGQETQDLAYPFDRDFLEDTDYTSRFNGTSAAAPVVTGVIALMLEANPNLSWRDVQEILVRSARQNAEFEVPQNGFGQGANVGSQNTWIINQTPVFHDPDFYDPTVNPFLEVYAPELDPNASVPWLGHPNLGPADTDAIRLILQVPDNIPDGLLNIFLSGFLSPSDHYQPQPHVLTNGAGYTVSQGLGFYGGDQIGFAHGTVDAEMAVLLAEQWHEKNQNLPEERTFTSFVNPQLGGGIPIQAAETAGDDAGNILIPGGIGGEAGFSGYWDEYFTDPATAFEPDEVFPFRGFPYIPLNVPDNNTMSVESVEVKVSVSGGTGEALDHLRLLLVSPDGTHSELNHYWLDDPGGAFSLQDVTGKNNFIGEPISVDNGGSLVWNFTSKRNWGERSDERIVFDPTTNEPVILDSTQLTLAPGTVMEQGWRLYIENWNTNTAFSLDGLEVSWHGAPIESNTYRVQGLVGVDDNEDDQFAFNRTILTNQDIFGDASITRLQEVVSTIDQTHESMGANVTVTVRRQSDNQIVDQFVTGADGNYYFDLVPANYVISVEDALGRVALDDSITGDQFLDHYRSEWVITEDYFKVWDYNAVIIDEVNVDADGDPLPFLDDNGGEVINGMRSINFLLDPGPPPAPEAVFNGFIYADVNGDGAFNGDDVGVPDLGVFGDINRNGIFDPGEPLVETGANGNYSLVVPAPVADVVSVGIIEPPAWVATNPSTGLQTFFIEPGDVFNGVDFAAQPPAGASQGDFNEQGRYILGAVFVDSDNDGVRDAGEINAPGFRVYLDNNNNGVFDFGDTDYETNANGAFVFSDMPAGTAVVRIEIPPNLEQSRPAQGNPFVLTVPGNGTLNGILFGIRDPSVPDGGNGGGNNGGGGGGGGGFADYGDLPEPYPTTIFDNGARHPRGQWFLGATVDGENTGIHSIGADSDDLDNQDDEDGISFNTLSVGTNTITVTASRHGGYLQGWMDHNGDGDFDDLGERIIRNELLDAGLNVVSFEIPVTATATTMYARFRYGEYSIDEVTGLPKPIDTVFGLADTGEVEDYAIPFTPPGAPLNMEEAADFDGDSLITGFDFLAWQRGYGSSGDATANDGDANGDRNVNKDDLGMWETGFGLTASSGQTAALQSDPASTGGFQLGNGLNGSDFIDMQRGIGLPTGSNEVATSSALTSVAVDAGLQAAVSSDPSGHDVALAHRTAYKASGRSALDAAVAEDDAAAALAAIAADAGQVDRVFDDLFDEADDVSYVAGDDDDSSSEEQIDETFAELGAALAD